MEARGISAPTRGSCTKSSHITQECVSSSPAALGVLVLSLSSRGRAGYPRGSASDMPSAWTAAWAQGTRPAPPARKPATRQEIRSPGVGPARSRAPGGPGRDRETDGILGDTDQIRGPAGPVQSPQDTHPYTQVHPRKHTPRDPDHRHEFTSRTYPETHTLCSGVCPTRAACEDPSLSTNLEGRSDLARFLPPSSHFPHSFPVLSAQGSPGSRSTDPGSWNEHPISRIERSPEELCKMKDFLGRREREQGSLLGKKPGHSGQCLVVFPVCKP
nr:PREDICTED: uncharacterized protein LOC109450436 isoform X2 [Rhinolophus sinicus]